VLVVGGGLVGLSVAWQLLLRGHPVALIDPQLEGAEPEHCGSAAALGVLMAQVFHRSSGRGWRLRQRSHALWRQWLGQLEARGHHLPQRQGLLLLAASSEELERQQRLVEERQRRGIALELWGPEQLAKLQPALPAGALGALHSPNDGQLDPGPVLGALWAECRALGLQASGDGAVALERSGSGWRVQCSSGAHHSAPWLVISAGVSSGALLAGLGHQLPMEPVLGQALELELAADPAWTWPGVAVWKGLNLVPRPDLEGGRRCWLGATLEPGSEASASALAQLRHWDTATPASELDWLATATVVRQWQGQRCRPVGRPAPVLEQLEPGLLVVSGHYRNGVLLAPASAEWACEQINTSSDRP
jgi:glycine/D-amino acid oxidase-like deaminating enzyme